MRVVVSYSQYHNYLCTLRRLYVYTNLNLTKRFILELTLSRVYSNEKSLRGRWSLCNDLYIEHEVENRED